MLFRLFGRASAAGFDCRHSACAADLIRESQGALFSPKSLRKGSNSRRRQKMSFANLGIADICHSSVYPMRILVVEDDDKIASFVANGLKQSGFAVDRAKDGEQGLDFALTISYDAAVLDLMLPGLDGLSLLRQLRQKKVSLPVLILSAKAGVDDRVFGLQSGGDDYLTKPFAFSELLARVQALIRRSTHSAEPSHLSISDLKMDLFTREVVRDGQKIELQSREFALLELLLRHAGRPVTKTMILEHVWDFSFDPQTNVVDVLMHRLRSKVDKGFTQKLIHTVRGVGYVVRAN
jgi:two-component system, OmpR family, response regulator